MIETATRVRGVPIGRGRVLAILAAAAALGIGAGVTLHLVVSDSTRLRPASGRPALNGQATWPAGTHPAPAIDGLRDQNGQVFSLSALRGQTVALTFLDSRCRQACPLEGRTLAASLRVLPRRLRPTLLVVSVNPRDTPVSTRAALRRWGLAALAPWHWLRGSHAELIHVWRAYRVFVAPASGDIVHAELLYLLDRHGDERSGYLYPFLPRPVAHDLSVLGGEYRDA